MNSLKWLILSAASLALLALAFPLHLAVSLKGFYIVLAPLIPLYFLYLSFKNADSVYCLFKASERNKKPVLSNFKKFALAFLLIVFMGTLGGLTFYRSDKALRAQGVLGKAIITSGVKTTTKKIANTEQSFSVDFSFIAKNGKIIKATENVSQEEYNNLSIGMPIEIIYLPNHPNVLRLLLNEQEKLDFKR
jgi:hypothetical protein